ncbi:hypothetical protein EL22_07170 [Halostagnicola sp. A56]|nr:hypothetical protein EL22_07170 [Halostagnicola sp. A56]
MTIRRRTEAASRGRVISYYFAKTDRGYRRIDASKRRPVDRIGYGRSTESRSRTLTRTFELDETVSNERPLHRGETCS